jgi:hypothetical protein
MDLVSSAIETLSSKCFPEPNSACASWLTSEILDIEERPISYEERNKMARKNFKP